MSENHIRGISVTLALLDKALCEFERWAKNDETRSVLYEIRNTLSEDQQNGILLEVSAMKKVLLELRGALKLEPTIRRVPNMIASSCGVLWASLVELETKRLRRYGEVPPTLTEILEPRVPILIDRLHRIGRLASRGTYQQVSVHQGDVED
jgi:hypothetical protein